MSDFKTRLLKKLQSGGDITYIGSLQMRTPLLMYGPTAYSPSAAPRMSGYGKGNGTSSRKSKGTEEEGAPEMYNSHKQIVAQIDNTFAQQQAEIDGSSLDHDQKAEQLAQLHQSYASNRDTVVTEATQFKTRLDEMFKSSGVMKDIASEPVIRYGASSQDVEVLVETVDENGISTRSYAFLNPYDAQTAGLKVITASQAASYARNRPEFAAWLMQRDDINFTGLLGGSIRMETVRASMREQFKNDNVIKQGEDGTTFILNGKTYNSANIANLQANKIGSGNPLVQTFKAGATRGEIARSTVEAASRGITLDEYLRDLTAVEADIELDYNSTTKSKTKIKNLHSTGLLEAIGGSSAQSSLPYDELGPVPNIEALDDIKPTDRDVIKVTKKLSFIPGGTYELDPDADKNPTGTIGLGVAKIISNTVDTDVIHSTKLVGSNESLYSILSEKGNIDPSRASHILTNSRVSLADGVKLTYSVRLDGGTPEQSREVENMMALITMAMQGSQDYQGQKEMGNSIISKVSKHKDYLTEADFKSSKYKEDRKLLRTSIEQTLIEQGLNGDDLQEEVDRMLETTIPSYIQTANQSLVDKIFKEEIVQGSWFFNYFISKGSSEEKAKEKASRYKDYLTTGKYTIKPQLLVKLKVPLYDDDESFDLMKQYLDANAVGGSIQEISDMSSDTEDQMRQTYSDVGDLEGIWTTDVAIDMGTSKINIMKMLEPNNKNTVENDDTLNTWISMAQELFNDPKPLNDVSLYKEMIWKTIQM